MSWSVSLDSNTEPRPRVIWMEWMRSSTATACIDLMPYHSIACICRSAVESLKCGTTLIRCVHWGNFARTICVFIANISWWLFVWHLYLQHILRYDRAHWTNVGQKSSFLSQRVRWKWIKHRQNSKTFIGTQHSCVHLSAQHWTVRPLESSIELIERVFTEIIVAQQFFFLSWFLHRLYFADRKRPPKKLYCMNNLRI